CAHRDLYSFPTRRSSDLARLSLLDVERQSARSGYKIAGSYVSRIENGVVRNPSKDKLIGLAKGLGVPEEEVFAVARGKSLDEPRSEEHTSELQSRRDLVC